MPPTAIYTNKLQLQTFSSVDSFDRHLYYTHIYYHVYVFLSVKVTVELAWVEGLCSAGGDRGDKQVVTVPGNSAVPVYFTVVPLVIGNIPIQVEAYTKTARDQIKKDLKVTV